MHECKYRFYEFNDFIQAIFRCADLNNTYMVTLGKFGGSSLYWITEVTAGGSTNRATGVFVYASNTLVVLKIEDNGNTITVTLNGGNPLSYSSTTKNTNTKGGVVLSDSTGIITNRIKIDNYQAWK